MAGRAITRAAIIWLIVFGNSMFETSAQTVPPPRTYVFERLCPEANPNERDRYRVCDKLFREALQGTPDAVIFLRARLVDLITNTRENSDRAFYKYNLSVWSSFSLAIVAAVLSFLNVQWVANIRVLAVSLAFLVVALTTAFGWHSQYKAEFAASQALTALRDELDIVAVHAASSGGSISSEQLAAFVKAYRETMAAHAKAYADSFSTLSLSQILK